MTLATHGTNSLSRVLLAPFAVAALLGIVALFVAPAQTFFIGCAVYLLFRHAYLTDRMGAALCFYVLVPVALSATALATTGLPAEIAVPQEPFERIMKGIVIVAVSVGWPFMVAMGLAQTPFQELLTLPSLLGVVTIVACLAATLGLSHLRRPGPIVFASPNAPPRKASLWDRPATAAKA